MENKPFPLSRVLKTRWYAFVIAAILVLGLAIGIIGATGKSSGIVVKADFIDTPSHPLVSFAFSNPTNQFVNYTVRWTERYSNGTTFTSISAVPLASGATSTTNKIFQHPSQGALTLIVEVYASSQAKSSVLVYENTWNVGPA